jgi:hypothetical protein
MIQANRTRQMKPLRPIATDTQVPHIEIDNSIAVAIGPREWRAQDANAKPCPLLGLAFVVLAVVSLFGVRTASATVIVGYRTPTEIVVGADSRTIAQERRPDGSIVTVRERDQCKLRRIPTKHGTTYLASAGHLALPLGSFDVYGLVYEMARSTVTTADLVTKSEAAIAKRFMLAAARTREVAPQAVIHAKEIDWVLETVFVGRDEHGVLAIHGRRFAMVRDLPELQSLAADCPPRCGKQPGVWFYGGDVNWIEDYFEKHPGYQVESIRQLGPTRAVIDLIEKVITANPTGCGLPIDVVRIPLNGRPKWIRQGPECRNMDLSRSHRRAADDGEITSR